MTTKTLPNSDTEKLSVNEADIFRLFIEFTEVAKATEESRLNLIALFRRVIQAGLHCVQSPTEQLTFREAAMRSLKARSKRRPSTQSDLRSYIRRFLELAVWVDQDIRYITQHDCRQLLETHFSKSGHVFQKSKSILHSIFSYAMRRGICDKNPVFGIDCPDINEERIDILSIRQVSLFMKALKSNDLQSMQAAIRLMLWCGIRPGEVQRLRWKDIDFREKVVYVDGNASKTGGARAVPLRGGAAQLKQFKQHPENFVAPRNWIKLWAKLRRRAGFKRWQKDAMRHTFASMHLKRFHNIYLLQEEMGHRDSNLLRTRYLNLRNLTSQAAGRFFNWAE